MTKYAKAFVVLGLIVSVGGIAQASTISYSTTIDYAKTDWYKTLAIQQFNSSLGHLNNITLTFASDISTILTIANDASTPSTGDAYTNVRMTVTDNGGYINKQFTASTLDNAFTYSLNAGQSITTDPIEASASSTINKSTNAGLLAEFTNNGGGTSFVNLNANTFTKSYLGNTGGNTAVDQATDAKLTGTVTYDYTVPEPATICLLGVGALIGMARRRRRQVVSTQH